MVQSYLDYISPHTTALKTEKQSFSLTLLLVVMYHHATSGSEYSTVQKILQKISMNLCWELELGYSNAVFSQHTHL